MKNLYYHLFKTPLLDYWLLCSSSNPRSVTVPLERYVCFEDLRLRSSSNPRLLTAPLERYPCLED